MKSLTILIVVFYVDIIATNECPERQKPNPMAVVVFDSVRKAENFCKKLNLFYTLWATNNEQREMNKQWDDCKRKVEPYFKEVEEDDNSISTFVTNVCSHYGLGIIEPFPCIDVIFYLEDLCYNMKSAADLFVTLGKHGYERIGGYSSIKLKGSDWIKFRSIGSSLNLHTCVTEFLDNYSHKLEVLQVYKNWWDQHKTSGQDCTCTEIFGLDRIFNARKTNQEDVIEKNMTLKNYFEEICLGQNDKKHLWNKQHFLSISESKYGINILALKEFLMKGTLLVEAGWGKTQENFNEWSFDDVYEAIDMKSYPNKVSDELIKLISHAIRSGLTPNDYKRFLMVVTKEGYDSVECLQLIFNEVFDIEKENLLKSSNYYIRNKHFWVKNDKTVFNDQLEILIQIYKKSNFSDRSCFGFANILKRFKQIIYKTVWTHSDITNLLKTINQKQKDIGNVLNCLNYCEEIETRISALHMLEPKEKLNIPENWQVTDDYVPQFAKFRKIFLEKPDEETSEICKSDHRKYNTGSRPNILMLMNYIVTNDENKYKTLQELFDTLSG